MAHRSLEETIDTIAPSRQRGIPNPPTLSVGVSSDNGDLSSALSQAGQQIQQLQSAYQQQADLITANTQALQTNTSSHSSSAGSTVGSIASSLFGGALGFLSPLISGIASLFGGSSTPTPLPIYTPPPPVSIDGTLQSAPATSGPTAASGSTSSSVPVSSPSQQTEGVATPTTNTLSPAGQQVAQLQSAYRLPASPLAIPAVRDNPAIQPDPAAPPAAAPPDGASGDGSAGFSGAALGYLSQIASVLTNGSAGGSSVSAALPIYTPPAAVPVSGVPQPQASSAPAQSSSGASGPAGGSGSPSNPAPQITVNVSAMDSQSFMDRSDDIATAVRAAMLNMHPINDVVADL